jgi:hypothetical protein
MALKDISNLIGTDVVLSETYQTPTEVLKEEEARKLLEEEKSYQRKKTRDSEIQDLLKFNPDAFDPFDPQVTGMLLNYQKDLEEAYNSGGDLDYFKFQKWKNVINQAVNKSKSIETSITSFGTIVNADGILNNAYWESHINDIYMDDNGVGKDLNTLNLNLSQEMFTKPGASKGYDLNKLAKLASDFFVQSTMAKVETMDESNRLEIETDISKQFVDSVDGKVVVKATEKVIQVLRNNPYVNRYIEDKLAQGISEKQAVEDLMYGQAGMSKTSRVTSNAPDDDESVLKAADENLIFVVAGIMAQDPKVIGSNITPVSNPITKDLPNGDPYKAPHGFLEITQLFASVNTESSSSKSKPKYYVNPADQVFQFYKVPSEKPGGSTNLRYPWDGRLVIDANNAKQFLIGIGTNTTEVSANNLATYLGDGEFNPATYNIHASSLEGRRERSIDANSITTRRRDVQDKQGNLLEKLVNDRWLLRKSITREEAKQWGEDVTDALKNTILIIEEKEYTNPKITTTWKYFDRTAKNYKITVTGDNGKGNVAIISLLKLQKLIDQGHYIVRGEQGFNF